MLGNKLKKLKAHGSGSNSGNGSNSFNFGNEELEDTKIGIN